MTEQLQADDLDPILDAIEDAEEIPNPLDGLVERAAEDPGAPFAPDVLECLIALSRRKPFWISSHSTRLV